MRRDAELGVLVHLAGADLHLDAACLRTDDGGVDRAIAVALGRGDVVVELAGDVGPATMHHPERGVTLRYRVHHDAHRAHVEQLREIELLALHLAVDAVDVLRPAVDLGADAGRLQQRAQLLAHQLDVALAVGAAFVQRGGDPAVLVRLEVAEREVLELPFELPHAQAVGQRRIDGACLQGAALRAPWQLRARGAWRSATSSSASRARIRRGSLTTASSILRSVWSGGYRARARETSRVAGRGSRAAPAPR